MKASAWRALAWTPRRLAWAWYCRAWEMKVRLMPASTTAPTAAPTSSSSSVKPRDRKDFFMVSRLQVVFVLAGDGDVAVAHGPRIHLAQTAARGRELHHDEDADLIHLA